jgi:predicted RNA-binding Zn-ribbon protein involved in translation (DUF1610 family)
MPAPKDPVKKAIWLEKQKLAHLNKHPSETTLNKMSGSHTGKEPWNKGKSSSLETREKQSAALSGKPKPPRSQEHCDNISRSKSGANNPMFGTHPQRPKMDNLKCPRCGSDNVKGDGSKIMKSGKEHLSKCNACGFKDITKKFNKI